MRMSSGVEWGLHLCLVLSWLEPGATATADQLSEYFDLPKAYLHKQIRLLARAGIVSSTTGPGGGYALARPLEVLSLMDVVAAIQGTDAAFRCVEIRRRGISGTLGDPDAPDGRCLIDQAMLRAEMAWRRELAGQTLATIRDDLDRSDPSVAVRSRQWLASAR